MMGMQVVREPKASDFAGLTGSARARAMKRAQKQSKNDYQGARGTRFALFPASAVAKKTPSWVMSTELVETSRLWARYSAAIDPAWAEPLAGQLTRTTYAEPHCRVRVARLWPPRACCCMVCRSYRTVPCSGDASIHLRRATS